MLANLVKKVTKKMERNDNYEKIQLHGTIEDELRQPHHSNLEYAHVFNTFCAAINSTVLIRKSVFFFF